MFRHAHAVACKLRCVGPEPCSPADGPCMHHVQMYSALSALSAHEAEVLAAVLPGAACVWVGSGFVPAQRVAFRRAPCLGPPCPDCKLLPLNTFLQSSIVICVA